MGPIGLQEILVISVIALLLFGAKRLPELARSMGEGIRQFKQGLSGSDAPNADADADDRTAPKS